MEKWDEDEKASRTVRGQSPLHGASTGSVPHIMEQIPLNVPKMKTFDAVDKDAWEDLSPAEKTRRKAQYANDPIAWIEETVVRNHNGQAVPVVLSDRQKIFILDMVTAIEAKFEMPIAFNGVHSMDPSWLVLYVMLWMWLFSPKEQRFLVGSARKAHTDDRVKKPAAQRVATPRVEKPKAETSDDDKPMTMAKKNPGGPSPKTPAG